MVNPVQDSTLHELFYYFFRCMNFFVPPSPPPSPITFLLVRVKATKESALSTMLREVCLQDNVGITTHGSKCCGCCSALYH